MEKAILIHNPTAGSGKHSKSKLMEKIKSGGYEVKYYSTDIPGWEKFSGEKADVIFIAGGDGTVQKVAKELLKSGGKIQKIPVQVLPVGTANNIASTLGLKKEVEKLVKIKSTQGFDTGEVKGAGEAGFFIEGIGFGIFPRLVKVMKAKKETEGSFGDPGEELQRSLRELLNIVNDYKAKETIIIADKEEIIGKFLLVELMNIRYIGPNFELAPNAKTGDGNFELVVVPEDSRKELGAYISALLHNRKSEKSLNDFAELRKVSGVRMKWEGHDVHIDDECIEDYSGTEITLKNCQNSFNFRRE